MGWAKCLAFLVAIFATLQTAQGCLDFMNPNEKQPTEGDPPDTVYHGQIIELLAAETQMDFHLFMKKFLAYGCFCGRGGFGIPRDELDKCCEIHDRCYGNVSSGLDVYFLSYSYNFLMENHHGSCVELLNQEKAQTKCLCDLSLGDCLHHYLDLDKYNDKYEGMRKDETCYEPPDP